MWVLFLEAGVALALFITIIWATMPRKKPDQPPTSEPVDAPKTSESDHEPR